MNNVRLSLSHVLQVSRRWVILSKVSECESFLNIKCEVLLLQFIFYYGDDKKRLWRGKTYLIWYLFWLNIDGTLTFYYSWQCCCKQWWFDSFYSQVDVRFCMENSFFQDKDSYIYLSSNFLRVDIASCKEQYYNPVWIWVKYYIVWVKLLCYIPTDGDICIWWR